MRKIALSLGVAATALAAPAMARDGEGYFGVDAGAVFPDEYSLNVPATGAPDVVIESETGWELAGVLGYDFGPVRTELEGA